MPPIRVFDKRAHEIPEGSNHEYSCTLTDLGLAIATAAVTSVRIWLDGLDADGSPTVINSRSNHDPLAGTIIATLVDVAGVATFTLFLTKDDAAIVAANASELRQWNRLTLKFEYNRTGGGTGQLTHEVMYPVRNLHRIP